MRSLGLRTRQVATALALVLFLIGCSAGAARLDTIRGPVTADRGCFTFPTAGELIVDWVHGTALKDDEGGIAPLLWPPGFTGRWVGSEVEVLDPPGNVVATTGRRYAISPLYEVPKRPEFVAGCVDRLGPAHVRDPL